MEILLANAYTRFGTKELLQRKIYVKKTSFFFNGLLKSLEIEGMEATK